jgi:nucleoid DNA-binding protein
VETIISHIETLLTEHDCVIVPGLGAFILNDVSAVWEENHQKLAAPHRVVYFNQTLHYDDGLLTETLRIAENITYRKAARHIAKAVTIWQQQLQELQQITIGRLGTLTLNEKHQIEFLPASSFDFLPDNIGIYSVRVPSYRSHSTEERQLVLHLPHISKLMAAAAAILILFLFVPTGQFHSDDNYAKMNPLDYFTNQFYNKQCQANSENSSSAVANNLLTTSKTTQPVPVAKNEQAAKSAENDWYLVVATFQTELQAKKSAKMLQQQEAMPLSVIKQHNLFRVVGQSFSTKEVALAALKTLRKNRSFETAWVVYDHTTTKLN